MAHFTQKAILQSFENMLYKMSFDKITVSAIVADCEISPNTFYYHYRDIYDLLIAWLEAKSKKYVEMISGCGWKEALKTLLRDIKETPEPVYHLSHSLSRERVEKYVFETMNDEFYKFICSQTGECDIDSETLRTISEYTCYAGVGFFVKFLWNNMKDDTDEAVDRIATIFDSCIEYAKENKIEKFKK